MRDENTILFQVARATSSRKLRPVSHGDIRIVTHVSQAAYRVNIAICFNVSSVVFIRKISRCCVLRGSSCEHFHSHVHVHSVYISDLSLFTFKFIWAAVKFNPRVILIITDAIIVDSGFR